MSDPTGKVPHLLGITLDSDGIAKSQVVATNLSTGERQIKSTDANKIVIFDAAEFTSGFSDADVILFENVGGSKGKSTITIIGAEGGFQEPSADMDCTTALTIALEI